MSRRVGSDGGNETDEPRGTTVASAGRPPLPPPLRGDAVPISGPVPPPSSSVGDGGLRGSYSPGMRHRAAPMEGSDSSPYPTTCDADAAAGTMKGVATDIDTAVLAATLLYEDRGSSPPQSAGNGLRSASKSRRLARKVSSSSAFSEDAEYLLSFRDSEADFLVLHSSESIAGDLGYNSSADSQGSAMCTPIPTPPTSTGGSGSNQLIGILPQMLRMRDTRKEKHTPSPRFPLPSAVSVPLGIDDQPARKSMIVLGQDISHLSRQNQFLACASGVFFFSLFYGFLQELISVKVCCRQLGLFQASAQFFGYTFYSFLMHRYVKRRGRGKEVERKARRGRHLDVVPVAFEVYLGLSLLRAVDLGATNLAMQYVNYPAKTLMKSSRVVFTMIFGVLVSRRRYAALDYAIVLVMVAGLAVFMHADATSSAIFQPVGVIMLVVSLLCDGAISNVSEKIMKHHGVGQDEFIFQLYSIAFLAITVAAWFKNDLTKGIQFLSVPGTLDEIEAGADPTWSVAGKAIILILFSTMGFFGSSCAAAITKEFGALTMSITSTARKATTLFLSFAVFGNDCTPQHVWGIVLFLAALIMKSIRANRRGKRSGERRSQWGGETSQ